MDPISVLEGFLISTSGLGSDKELIEWTGQPVVVVDDSTGGFFILASEEPLPFPPEPPHQSMPSPEEKKEQRISVDPNIMGGAPVISGTRIPVYLIKELAEGGYIPEQIIEQLPGLSIEDVQAALEYQD